MLKEEYSGIGESFSCDFICNLIYRNIKSFITNMTYLVSKIEVLLLKELLDSLYSVFTVYLVIENNILSPFECVREIIDRAVNSSLLKIEGIEQKTKVLEVLSQVGKNSDYVISIFNDDFMAESRYISVRGLKVFKVLNIEKKLYLDHSQEEIKENINKLKYKLEANTSLYSSLRQTLKNFGRWYYLLKYSKALKSNEQSKDEKILKLIYVKSSRIICINSKKVDDGVKLWRETLDEISFIVKDLSDISRYFHLDHSEIPLTPYTSHIPAAQIQNPNAEIPNAEIPNPKSQIPNPKSQIIISIFCRNLKSQVPNTIQALKQANIHPPRNVDLSPTVSSPPHNKY
ncbi:hypothetical protein Glove_120g41 [Diversispora epigaea]|uniref:Uncharacterized protein n=1 Tax=Diversispora epigaea TaxID=1348612 RepID=A0A397IZS6_9GLOM|nr:hypothetical protein Glove_120g41 [Diversispora epigaea]